MKAIEVKNLTKFYGNSRGITDVSFSLEKGEIVGFLGPNGSGKTTTMRILTCFFPPTSGTAKVCGYDVTEEPLEVKRRIGYLPETVPLYLDMPVKSYLGFFADVKGISKKNRQSALDDVIGRCGLSDVSHRLIGKLSKGYRQRVGIAQALLNDPELLILDEPTIGLDPKQIIEIRNLVKSLGGRQSIILSTHILPEVSMTCDRVIIINEGKIIAVDTPENLMQKIQDTPKVIVVTDGVPELVLKAFQTVEGVMGVDILKPEYNGFSSYIVETRESSTVISSLAKQVYDNNWNLKEIRHADMTLEEIFINLVTKEEGVA